MLDTCLLLPEILSPMDRFERFEPYLTILGAPIFDTMVVLVPKKKKKKGDKCFMRLGLETHTQTRFSQKAAVGSGWTVPCPDLR